MLSLRSLRGPSDLPLLQAIDAACRAVGEIEAGGTLQDSVNLLEVNPNDWFLTEWDEQVVGYGHASIDWLEKDGTWVYLHLGRIHPEFRRRGIGTVLLRSLEERCRTKAQAAGHTDTLEIAANASGLEGDAAAFLLQHDYYVAYTMIDMFRRLDNSLHVIPTLPAGYELRPLLPEHHLAVWQSIASAYDARDRHNPRFGEVPRDDEYDWYFSQDPTLSFVAWRGKVVAGQVISLIRSDGSGELLEVSVGIGHQRKGLAHALMLHALHELKGRGVKEVWVGTRQENASQAWRQYEKLGFETVRRFPRWRKRRATVR